MTNHPAKFAAGLSAVALLWATAPLRAEDSAAPPAVDAAPEDIVITGVRQPYRGDFSLREIPQAIATIEEGSVRQNNFLRLADALDLNASVSRQNSPGGLFDSFAVRGFAARAMWRESHASRC